MRAVDQIPLSEPVAAEYRFALRHCRAPRLRTIRQFAEAEIVIPEGQFAGRRWRAERQPYAALLLDAFDSGRWNRFAVTGCVQAGKTFHAFVIPICYHLFEIGEPVIVGIPQMEMAYSKWQKELLPVIERTRYRDLLPHTGKGSRGGKFEQVCFLNGAWLSFMSGHGGDEKRSGETARVAVCTEVDKMDRPSEMSREADPITQIEDRTSSYRRQLRRIYLECTTSIEEGRIWREYQTGTTSRIVCPCVHCGAWVTPEREHLVGWQHAENEFEADREAAFACPECAALYTSDDRRRMNLAAKLIHRGQEIDPDGNIHGPLPPTYTLGFRSNAFNNLFWEPGDIGVEEFKGRQAEDDESQERKLRQFIWAIPHEPPELRLTPLDVATLRQRTRDDRRGVVPQEAQYLTLGIDVGKWICWWSAIAWLPGASGQVIDYGLFHVPSDEMDCELAILAALREFRDETIEKGWISHDGKPRLPDLALVDARYQGDRPGSKAVYQFCRESGDRYLAFLGEGQGRRYPARYHHPTKRDRVHRHLGHEYHVDWDRDNRLLVCHANVDHWKGWFQERLSTPLGQPGSVGFFRSSDRDEHNAISKHYAAEEAVEEFVPGVGNVVRFVQTKKKNHQLDTAVHNCVAGHLRGVRLIADPALPDPAPGGWFAAQKKAI